MLGVVLAQVRGLRGRDHHHRCAAAAEPLRDHDPRVPGRLNHHGQLARLCQVEVVPEPLQISRSGPELCPATRSCCRPRAWPDARPGRPRRFPMSTPSASSCQSLSGSQVTDHRGHGPDILQAGSPARRLAPSSRTGTPLDQTPSPRATTRCQGSPRVPVGTLDRPRTHRQAKCRSC